jgi:hypothetical protein
MKTLFIVPLVLFTLLGCSKDSKKEEPTPAFVGKWQLIEVYTGGPPNPDSKWVQIDNGYILSLNKNKTFTTTQFTECNTGTFFVTEEILTYKFSCGNDDGTPDEFRIYSNTENELIINNIYCIEGCDEKFKRIE